MAQYYIQQNNKIIMFDENKQKLENTLLFTPEYKDLPILETSKEIIQYDGGFVFKEDVEGEILEQAKQIKLKETSEKAFEYRNSSGLISFNARPIDTSLLNDDEITLTLHTELLNQDDFFQRMSGFAQGLYTDDIIYNTKEDVLVYLNAQETQAIYMAIVERAGKLWNEDYMYYKNLIEACETVDEVEGIVIDYDAVPVDEENNEVTDDETNI